MMWATGSSGSSNRHQTRRRVGPIEVIVLSAAMLFIAVGYLVSSPSADAKQQFLSRFSEAFPAAAGTSLDSCVLCHTNPSNPTEDNINQYAEDWEDGDIGDRNFRAAALLRRDSDGDGISNGDEIDQLSFPGSAASNTPPTTTTTIVGTPPNGQSLFAAQCAVCHGPDGGDLSGTALGRATFVNITLNGQGSMPAQTGLTQPEARAIWSYVTGATPATTTTTTTTPGATTTTTAPRTGSAVYADTCAICHGPSGGNLVPTTLTRSRLVSIMTNGVGSMRGYPELGAAQIDNVASYLLGLGTTTTTTTTPGATTTTPPTRSGSAIYADSCAACHGPNGGNLRDRPLSLSQIVGVTTNGTAGMPGYGGNLSGAEISSVSRYVLSFAAGTGTTTTTSEQGGSVSGAELYMQSCSACHGFHGEGGSGGPLAGVATSRAQITAVIESGTEGMPGYTAMLSPVEIEAIADHVAAMTPGTGVPSTEGPGQSSEVEGAVPAATTSTTAAMGDPEPAESSSAASAAGTIGLNPPSEPGGGSPIGAVLVTLGMLLALIVGGRSLRNITRWSEDG